MVMSLRSLMNRAPRRTPAWWMASLSLLCASSFGRVALGQLYMPAPTERTTPTPSARPASASLRASFGVARWLDQLNSPNASARLGAVQSLVRYVGNDRLVLDEAIERIAERLRAESEPEVQAAIVDGLASLARERAVPLFLSTLSARGSLSPQAARRALELCGPQLDRDGIDALARAIESGAFAGSDETRSLAIVALSVAPDEPFSDRVAASRTNPARIAILLEAIGRRGDGRWGSAVIEQLAADQGLVLIAAIRAASELRILEAASYLARLVRVATTPSDVQIAAVRALAVVGAGDPDATREALRAALDRPATAAIARSAIAKLGIRALTEQLARGLDAVWIVDRRETAEALGDLGGPDAAQRIRAALANESDGMQRRILWRAALRADDTSTVAALASAAASDSAARWAALEHGVGRGQYPRIASARAEAQRGDVSAMALQCALGDSEPALSRLRSEQAAQRIDGYWALSFAPSADVPRIAAAFERETDVTARLIALFALARSSDAGATRALERAWPSNVDGPLEVETVLLAELLSARSSALPRLGLRAMLEDDRPFVRAVALSVAARAGDGPTLSAARRLATTDPSLDVRAVAQASIRSAVDPRIARGRQSLHATGLAPNALWIVWLPDGHFALTVGASDGTLLVPGVPAADFDVERVR